MQHYLGIHQAGFRFGGRSSAMGMSSAMPGRFEISQNFAVDRNSPTRGRSKSAQGR